MKKSAGEQEDEEDDDGSEGEQGDSGFGDEAEGTSGKMFVNQHMIKICFKSTTPTNEEKKVKPGKS